MKVGASSARRYSTLGGDVMTIGVGPCASCDDRRVISVAEQLVGLAGSDVGAHTTRFWSVQLVFQLAGGLQARFGLSPIWLLPLESHYRRDLVGRKLPNFVEDGTRGGFQPATRSGGYEAFRRAWERSGFGVPYRAPRGRWTVGRSGLSVELARTPKVPRGQRLSV